MITILTATYNRANLLPRLYESLKKQTCKDFEWLIIDDGSQDDTSQVVNHFNSDFPIIYKYKDNGGKHTALNYSYQFIKNPLVFIVDSDDYLTNDAVQIINETYQKYKDENDLCGFSFLRGKPNGGYLSDSGVSKDGIKESYVECRVNRGIGGDMAEVWYTHCLKEYPFPEFKNEKFLGEDLVWVKLSKKYKLRFFNKVIYISDYLEDGLTNNRRIHNIKSPNGCVARAEAFLESDCCLKVKIKSMLQYQIYGRFAGNKKRMEENKFLYILMYSPSLILYNVWKRKY